MSSTYNPDWHAFTVVDGIRNTDIDSGSCLHTGDGKGEWWAVDLGTLVDVYAVVLTNRGNYSRFQVTFQSVFPKFVLNIPNYYMAEINAAS